MVAAELHKKDMARIRICV